MSEDSQSIRRRVAEQVREQVERETAEAIAKWLETPPRAYVFGTGIADAVRRGDWKQR